MGTFLPSVWTIIAIAVSTAATTALIYRATTFIIADHKSTSSRNDFKIRASASKSKLVKIAADFSACCAAFRASKTDPLHDLDDSLSGSTLVISEKLVLETEEHLLRLLEQSDAIKCGDLASDLELLIGTQPQLQQLKHGLQRLVTSKKELVGRIQGFFNELDRVNKS